MTCTVFQLRISDELPGEGTVNNEFVRLVVNCGLSSQLTAKELCRIWGKGLMKCGSYCR